MGYLWRSPLSYCEIIPTCPRLASNPGRWIYRQTLYHITVKVSFYLKAVVVCFKYSKTCLKQSLKKKTKNWFSDQLLFNAGQKYCRMLQGEHSAILSTFIKLPFAIKTFVLSFFEWPLKTGFTVPRTCDLHSVSL